MNTAIKLSQLARDNKKKQEENPLDAFDKKVRWGSHQYVRFLKKECKKLALQGYGSVRITIDRTTELFMTDEGRNSCYSSSFVISLLCNEGFRFSQKEGDYEDHYDAFTNVLIWDENLPQAPNSNRIGMCWK